MDKQTLKLLGAPSYLAIIVSDLLGRKYPVMDNRRHIDAAIEWLVNAQDVSADDGVSLGFSLQSGWEPSYPETTGYIIPTILDYYKLTGDEDYLQRALRMADWLISVQLECGATQGGPLGRTPEPCVFNTGQNLFGFIRAYREGRDERYYKAALHAGEWLVDMQDDDGVWRRHVYGNEAHLYNTRTAWGLLLLHEISSIDTLRQAAVKNLDWAIDNQQVNGWYKNNAFTSTEDPFTHTIAYAARGILEAGIILKEQKYIDSARSCADALLKLQRSDGSLAATYNGNWEATANYSCLTGNAQTAIIWLKLYQITKEDIYLQAAYTINRFVKSTQNLTSANPGIKGGIKGSYPISGAYQWLSYPDWAAKFFVDALMLEDTVQESISGIS